MYKIALVFLLSFIVTFSCAVEFYWTNTLGGSLTSLALTDLMVNLGNGTLGIATTFPTSADTMVIDAAGTYTVSIGATGVQYASLIVGGSSGTQTLQINGPLSVTSGLNINSNGLVVLGSGGSVNGNVAVAGQINLQGGSLGNGQVTVTGGLVVSTSSTISAALSVTGTAIVNAYTTFQNTVNITNSASFNLTAQTYFSGSTLLTGSSTLNMASGASVTFNGNTTLTGSATISGSGSVYVGSSQSGTGTTTLIVNTNANLGASQLNINSNGLVVLGAGGSVNGNVAVAGQINLQGGSLGNGQVTVTGGLVVSTSSTISAALSVTGTAIVNAYTTFQNAVNIASSASFSLTAQAYFSSSILLTDSSTLNVASGASVTFNGNTTLTGSAIISGSGTVNVGSLFNWQSGTVTGTTTLIVNTNAKLRAYGTSARAFTGTILRIAAGAIFSAEDQFILTLGGSTVFRTDASGTATFSASATIQASSGASFDNAGTIQVMAGVSAKLLGSFKNDVGGLLNCTGDVTLTANAYTSVDNTSTVVVNSNLNLAAGNSIDFQNSVIRGNGTINGSVNISGNGALNAGNSPGFITINGNLNIGFFASLIVEMQGKTFPGTDYDYYTVTGTATLKGTLKLNYLTDSVGLNPGDSFNFMTYNSVDPGFFYAVINSANGLPLLTRSVTVSYGSSFATANIGYGIISGVATNTFSIMCMFICFIITLLF